MSIICIVPATANLPGRRLCGEGKTSDFESPGTLLSGRGANSRRACAHPAASEPVESAGGGPTGNRPQAS